MKFNIDLSKEGYRVPGNRSEKFYALIGLLNEGRRRHLDTLAKYVGKSTRQIRRDLEKISSLYTISYDEYKRPYILDQTPIKKDRIHQLVDILVSDERKSLEELARQFAVSTRTIRRDLSLIEKFFNLDYDFHSRPFIFQD
jgi:predicted DNA-binding transcriptional regulator YafY